MRKAAFFLFAVFTCYLAAMYRSLPLMLLCAAELLLAAIMFFLSRFFRTKLTARFTKQGESTEAGMNTVCRISILNKGRLPVNRVAVRLRIGYRNVSKSVKKVLYSSSECGESDLSFQICFSYCGLVRVRMDMIRAFDYLSLFSSAKVLSEEMDIAVFPKKQELSVKLSDIGPNESFLPKDETVSRLGDAHNEIRQIREYRTGEPNRHIHWNQSAKTDRLWIKEYEKETDSRVNVFADMTGAADTSQETLSAFYHILSALVLGALKEAAEIMVYWYSGSECGLAGKSVCNAEQCRDMLLELYRSDFTNAAAENSDMRGMPLGERGFRLTLSLDLSLGNELIYRFSQKDFEREIKEKVFMPIPF